VTDEEKARWDERYSTGDYEPRWEPSPLVDDAIDLVRTGRALVLACGAGRNALRLAEAGFEVTAVDISSVAIEMAKEAASDRGLDVDWRVADVRDVELSRDTYDLITMIRFVDRYVWPDIPRAITENGWLLMEQHLRTYRDVIGPSGDYRLAPGELLDAFSAMRIIHYSEAFEPSERSSGMTATARLLACKGDPGW
jgi:tellurite methyltransferase